MRTVALAVVTSLALGATSLRVVRRWAAALLALPFLVLLAVATAIAGSDDVQQATVATGLPTGARPFLAVYHDAAEVFDVNPYVLMAVHEDESAFSTSPLTGVRTGVNGAGCCAGPMQFSITTGATPAVGGRGGTWERYRQAVDRATVDRPADYPGRFTAPDHASPNVYDTVDSLYAAAAYLHELGAGPKLDDRTLNALSRYKGTPPASLPYARHDLERARELAHLATTTLPTDGLELDVVPGTTVDKLIAYATAIEDRRLPYCWGGGHAPTPGPSRIVNGCWNQDDLSAGRAFTGAGLDCSGAVRWLLVLAGFPDPGPLRSDLLGARYPAGPGRRVTLWSTANHIFLTIDGRAWGTGTANHAHGPGWAPHPTAGFRASHPSGM